MEDRLEGEENLMKVNEMDYILKTNNISYIKKDDYTFQEMHVFNEDYYELRIGYNEAVVCYEIKERNDEEVEIFRDEIEKAIKYFLLILLSKEELVYSRKERNKLILDFMGVMSIDDIGLEIGKYHKGIDFDVINNQNVAINILKNGGKYILNINKNEKVVYCENIATFEKAKARLIFYLFKNEYIQNVIEKGKYNEYALILDTNDYELYFKPLRC